MANSEHLAIIKSGVEEWNAWRKKNLDISPDLRDANLRGAQLDNAILRDADLSGANLSGASLKEADLSKAVINEANLSGADLSRANLYRAKMRRCNLTGADMRQVVLYQANLTYANLSRANLSKANLRKANVSKADLSKVYFSKGKAEETSFNEANLEKANLYESNLVQADLTDANLSGAVMYKANLSEADFEGANLKNANLNLTNLQNATLNRTQLEGAKLTGSTVSNISIHDAVHSNSEQLDLVVTQSDGVLVKCDDMRVANQLEKLLRHDDFENTLDSNKLVVLLGNFSADRKIIKGRILEEVRKDGLNPLQLECLSTPEAEFRAKLNRLAGATNWLIFDATQAADLIDQVLPILTNYPDLKVTAFVESATRWQVATPFAHYVERFPLGEYENPEDIPELLSFSRSQETQAPRLIILPDDAAAVEEPQAQPQEIPDSEETIQLNPAEIMALAGKDAEIEAEVEENLEAISEELVTEAKEAEEVPIEAVEEEISVEEDVEEEDIADEAPVEGQKEEEQIEETARDEDDSVEEFTEETLSEHYTGDNSDSFIGENVVIVPANGQAPSVAASSETKAEDIVITAPKGSKNPFADVMNPVEKTTKKKVDLKFPTAGQELMPAQKTVVILEGDERQQTVKPKSNSRIWIGLAAAAVLFSGMFFGWNRLHSDVMIVAPKSANAFIQLNGNVVSLHKQEGDKSYYLAESQFIGNTPLTVFSTQISEMGQEEFVRYKRYEGEIDVSRGEDGIFTYEVGFQPLYRVSKVATGKFPAIDAAGKTIAYTKAADNSKRNARQELYIKDLQSGTETKVEPRNRRSLNWDGERPYLLGDGESLFIGAYQYRADKTLPYRVDLASGQMTKLDLPANEKWLSFLPLAGGEKLAFRNKLYDAEGNELKEFSSNRPYLDKLYPAGDDGLLFFDKTKNKKNRISFDCYYSKLGSATPQKLFSVSANIPPFVSASKNAETVVVSTYSGLNREFLSTVRMWKDGQFVDLSPRYIDGSRDYADGSEYHQTEAVVDASGKHIVYEYESNIYLIEIMDGVTFADIQQAEKPAK
ncbi:MAG: pentapeptide repeat-containing protein [Calditrichia bacterium]